MSGASQPDGPEVHLTPERLTGLLGDHGHPGTVVGVDAVPIGTGQMAGSYRLLFEVAGDPGALPATMVAKVPVGQPDQRALSANSYRTEVDFYARVAPLLAARMPHCWAAWRNATGEDFILLLEDLAPFEPGDQIEGCTVDRAATAVRNLAAVHGPVWEDRRLEDLLSVTGPAEIDGTREVFEVLTGMFLDAHRERLSAQAVHMCETFAPLAPTFLTAQADHVGIVHGDYRLDNLLFAADGSEVAVVDWQTVGLGLPGRDLAYFLGTSLDTTERRGAEADLIGAYHDALASHGVTGYGLEACRADYAFGLFQIPLSVMFGAAIAGGTDRGADMFTVMIERGAAAMADNGTLGLV